MQWLRVRPQDPEELDLVDWRGQWYEDAEDEYDDEEDEDRPMEDFDPVSSRAFVTPIKVSSRCL